MYWWGWGGEEEGEVVCVDGDCVLQGLQEQLEKERNQAHTRFDKQAQEYQVRVQRIANCQKGERGRGATRAQYSMTPSDAM